MFSSSVTCCDWRSHCSLTFCLECILPLCAGPSQTSHMVWSSAHIYLLCWKNGHQAALSDHWSRTLRCVGAVSAGLPVVDYLHCSVLLDPQFTQDDVMNAAHWVCPRVRLFMSGAKTKSIYTQVHKYDHDLINEQNICGHPWINQFKTIKLYQNSASVGWFSK